MHRFKITELETDVFWLREQERDHIVRVLRFEKGDKIVGYDNTGAEYLGEIAAIDERSVACRIIERKFPAVEAKAQVYLVAGLSKGEKMEWVLQKGTELGMAGLLPLRTRRAVVRLEGQKAEERVKRWQKICAEAAKQCGRVKEPHVFPVSDWEDIVKHLPANTQFIIPYEGEKELGLKKALGEMDVNDPVAVIIGPEGGFERSEVSWAIEQLKACPVTLGPRILRAETAALVSLTLVLGEWGDLG